MNLNSLMTNKTFCYLTQPDLVQAFNRNQTILLAKDSQTFQIISEDHEPQPAVMIKGTDIRPVKFLVVNNEKESIHYIGDEEIAKLNQEDEEMYDDSQNQFESRTKFKKTDDIVLFRRKLTSIPLNDHDESELSQIASKVLTNNKHKGKSKFHIVNENNLVHSSDLSDPGFLQLDPPSDADYEDNYSFEPPSIHDLYDLDVPRLESSQNMSYEVDENEEDMIEEYIVEEIEEYNDEIMAI